MPKVKPIPQDLLVSFFDFAEALFVAGAAFESAYSAYKLAAAEATQDDLDELRRKLDDAHVEFVRILETQ